MQILTPADQQARTWRIVIVTALLAVATYYLLPAFAAPPRAAAANIAFLGDKELR